MTKTLAMFPGQGSQYVGMGRALLDEFPATKMIFEEAEDAARAPLRKLCLDGPEEDLKLTANTQPCILAVSVAIWSVLRNESGFEPSGFAGHSLGEYSALVAAEKLTLSQAALLTRRRGLAMQEAVPAGVGAMAAVMKHPAAELEEACKESSSENALVQVVNYNSPDQLVVAGHKSAVSRLVKKLEEKAVRCVMLPVSAPFHSQLMGPARDQMAPLLEETSFSQNQNKIYINLSGLPVEEYKPEYLIDQINHPVLWTQTMANALEDEFERYVEVGPGKVLFGLGRRTLPRNKIKLLNTESVKDAITALK